VIISIRLAVLLAFASVAICAGGDAKAAANGEPSIVIQPAGAVALTPLTGRMLLFVAPARGARPPDKLEPGFVADAVELIGFEVAQRAGSAVAVPETAAAFPKTLRDLHPGTYDVQPLLDRRHMYTYDGIAAGDLFGPVQRVRIAPGKPAHVLLSQRDDTPEPVATSTVKLFSMRSAVLSAFYGRTATLRAGIVLPLGYDARRRYPVVYVMNGFGGTFRSAFRLAKLRSMMAADGLDAIVVVTDSSGPTGITEFADSATNGPWGRAFVREFVPAVERAYPIEAVPWRRLLWGHSSGGWASLWLQVTYPDFFGGTWSSSPDPVDFHDFTGPDLVDRPLDNAFFDRFGRPWELVRIGDRNVFTLRDFVRSSGVLGYRSSQFGSFDAVFGPAGAAGRPVPLFNVQTGAIDPAVAAYWEAHYDIATKLERDWPELGPRLAAKLHVAVGTLDTFHLERGVLRLDARLRRLGVTPDITYFPGASHFSLFQKSSGFEGFHWAFRGMAAALRR
jgi:hypothetical protein